MSELYEKHTIATPSDLVDLYDRLSRKDAITFPLTIEIKKAGKSNTRTLLQNRALHKLFTLIADELNSAGWDMAKTLHRRTADIPWDEHNVKEHLWRPIQEAMTQKASTAQLTTTELSEIYEVLNRHLSTKLGVSVPFPERQYFYE